MDIEQLAGTKLGSYEIEILLGRGGMGVVYKARQVSLNRPVALKILPPALSSDPSYIKRFQREAQAVAKLSHPNIVQIHDIAHENDLHFFSMEHIEGQTLDDLLREKGKLEVNEAIKIIAQAAEGIEHAHENGILHRDIKPSNMILNQRGDVKVMDFGLARMSGEGSRLTQSGTLMGTLDYMSPEQCRGEELDEQTDIYSLGVVLYEMLTDRLPFEAPNEAALIHKIINEESAEVTSVNPNVPSRLNDVVSRALSKTREDRYQSIVEFLEDVRNLSALGHSTAMSQEKPSPSIVVLPFVNMSADPEQEYFCDGLAEELINALTQIEDLKVIARTSAFSFKDKNVNVRDIGRELDVGSILEGSVRKAGNRLRITAQLVDTARGHHLWSERYDRELNDVFAIQDEITMAIVERLKPKLLGIEKERLAKRQTVDLEAYNLCLRGRWFWIKLTDEALRKAIECFEQAIERSPGYAPAYAGLADAYTNLPLFSYWDPAETFPKAKEATQRALEIDDTLAEPHSSLGWIKTFYDWDWENAEKGFKRAITLNPSYALAHNRYAMYLYLMTRFEDALEEIGKALELDPLSIVINNNIGEILLAAGQYDQAEEAFKRAIEMDPAYTRARLSIVRVYLQKSMYAEAMEEIEKQESLSRGFDPLYESFAGIVDVLMGKRVEGERRLDDLLKRSTETYVPPSFISGLYFALGEKDKGFKWLDKAYEKRDPFLSLLKVNPVLKAFDLQTDPRYIALLKKMGLDK
jgi:serine/threonine protein kinase